MMRLWPAAVKYNFDGFVDLAVEDNNCSERIERAHDGDFMSAYVLNRLMQYFFEFYGQT